MKIISTLKPSLQIIDLLKEWLEEDGYTNYEAKIIQRGKNITIAYSNGVVDKVQIK